MYAIIPFFFLLFFTLVILFESFLIVFRSYRALTAVNIGYSVAFVYVHWYALKNEFSLSAVLCSLLVLVACRLAFYIIIFVRNARQVEVSGTDEGYAPGQIRKLWLHLGIYDVLQVLFGYTDKFVVSLLLAAQASAIYFNGSQNIPFLPLLISAAGSAVLMQLAKGDELNEKRDVIYLMNQVGRVLSCIVFPVFLFLFLYRQAFIVTVFSDKYIPAIPIFAVALMVLPLRAYHFTTILQRKHKGAIINIGATADLLVACALIYPLYNFFGLPGVALGFVISTYLQASFYLVSTARVMNVSPWRLIPVGNMVVKMIVFAVLLGSCRYALSGRFATRETLMLGGVGAMLVAAISLLIEFRSVKKQERF